MPWFPDFANAAELARRQTRAARQADPVTQYFTALNEGDTRALETVWPGEVVIYDPRAGEVRGHKQLRQFVSHNLSWLSGRDARIETVASTSAGGRAVVELLAHLAADGREVAWPVAVVARRSQRRARAVALRSSAARTSRKELWNAAMPCCSRVLGRG
jgi:ketosteroid isomerase-like protein